MGAANIALGVLAGAFIAMGAIFATTVTAGGTSLPYGVARLLAGLDVLARPDPRRRRRRRAVHRQQPDRDGLGEPARVDCAPPPQLGARLHRQLRRRGRDRRRRLRGKQYTFGKGAVGEQALAIAAGKTNSASCRRSRSARSATRSSAWPSGSATAPARRPTRSSRSSRRSPRSSRRASSTASRTCTSSRWGCSSRATRRSSRRSRGLADLAHLTWGHFFVSNLLPVTIGNIIGGGVMVGAVYWFVYLRPRRT